MIISYKNKFIFLKTRKTGSSSIQMALSSVCGEDDIIVGDANVPSRNIDFAFYLNPHANLKQTKFSIQESDWNLFFKFTFVRNPWDLVVSRYHWQKRGLDCSIEDFQNWLPLYLNHHLSSSERNEQSNIIQSVWQKGGGYILDLQSPFVFDDETIGLDFIGRYESLSDDYKNVCQRLGIQALSLPRLKSGFREPSSYRDFYDDFLQNLVAQAFSDDIEHFGYAF